MVVVKKKVEKKPAPQNKGRFVKGNKGKTAKEADEQKSVWTEPASETEGEVVFPEDEETDTDEYEAESDF